MSNRLEAGIVRHSYHNCKYGYMMCLCAKFDIKPNMTSNGTIRPYIYLKLEKEGIDICWYCLSDDREKWNDYWSSDGVKQTLHII
jgi:hypothetical protein